VSVIVTFDRSLTNKYAHEFAAIQGRFEAMVASLEPPFCYAGLPEVMLSREALRLIQCLGRNRIGESHNYLYQVSKGANQNGIPI